MWELLKAVVLGIIQGLTEFLPISSSAHLRIFPELFGWGDPGAAFTAVIQIGTELAVLLYFRQDIWRIASHLAALAGASRSTAATSTPGWAGSSSSARCRSWSSACCSRTSSRRTSATCGSSPRTLIVLGIVLGLADRVGSDRQADQADHAARRDPDGRAPRRWPWCPGSPAPARPCRWAGSSATSARPPPATRSCSRSRPSSAPGSSSSRRSPAATTPTAGARPWWPRSSRSSSGTPRSRGCCATSRRTPTRRS